MGALQYWLLKIRLQKEIAVYMKRIEHSEERHTGRIRIRPCIDTKNIV